MNRLLENKDLRWLLLAALILIGAGIGLRFPGHVDEERFIGIALEMLQNGTWLIPHRAGELYGEKPPLFFWTLASLIWLTGSPKFALLFPGLLSSVVSTLLIYDLTGRLYDRQRALIAGGLFLLTMQTHAVLRNGQIDALLCLWMSIGFYGFARHLLVERSWGWYYAACVACGLGVITKGVGFFPAMLLIPYVYALKIGASGVVRHPASAGKWLLGMALIGLTAAIWIGPVLWVAGVHGDAESHAYLYSIFYRQTAERFTNAWHHVEPFWFYALNVIPKYWLPAVLLLPWLAVAWFRRWREKDGRIIVLLGWMLLVVVLFSLGSGKRKLYIYPAVIAWAMVVAAVLPGLLEQWKGRWLVRHGRTLVVVWAGLLFAFGGFEIWKSRYSGSDRMMQQVASTVGTQQEIGLGGWLEGVWIYSRNPLRHFGKNNAKANANLLAWLNEDGSRWGLAGGDFARECFDMARAIDVTQPGEDAWFLVNAGMSNGRCEAIAAQTSYAVAWKKSWF